MDDVRFWVWLALIFIVGGFTMQAHIYTNMDGPCVVEYKQGRFTTTAVGKLHMANGVGYCKVGRN